MQQNKYDDPAFFSKYSAMPRSRDGLAAAGEWHAFRRMFPDLRGKRVVDLGCGFGWHCRYAAEMGASSVLGIDLSEKMLEEARRATADPVVEYRRGGIEDFAPGPAAFDVAISSLALHYVESFPDLCHRVAESLAAGGAFVFSVEHPIFTAQGGQDWFRDPSGQPLHWPVDRYFEEGWRNAVFLGEPVAKHHKTLTTYLRGLLQAGFAIADVVEPRPDPALLDTVPGMRDELRRPMMLLVSAIKRDEAPEEQ